MKRRGLLFVVFMLTAAVAFSGCGSSGGGGSGGGNNKPGKINVALTDADEFEGKDVICGILDSGEFTEEEGPTGNLLGFGIINVSADGSGSCVILDVDGNETFDPGEYYLLAVADLNGDFNMEKGPAPGDRITFPLISVIVKGDVTIGITGADFTMIVPDDGDGQ